MGKSIGNFFQIVKIWRNFFMINTRKLAYIAILSAVSFLLLYFSFPLIPAADFLKVDFSILPVLIALVIFDFKSAIGVLLLRSLLKLLLNNGGPGSMIGLPMNFVALGVFVWGLSYFWKKNQTSKNYILGLLCLQLLWLFLTIFMQYHSMLNLPTLILRNL